MGASLPGDIGFSERRLPPPPMDILSVFRGAWIGGFVTTSEHLSGVGFAHSRIYSGRLITGLEDLWR